MNNSCSSSIYQQKQNNNYQQSQLSQSFQSKQLQQSYQQEAQCSPFFNFSKGHPKHLNKIDDNSPIKKHHTNITQQQQIDHYYNQLLKDKNTYDNKNIQKINFQSKLSLNHLNNILPLSIHIKPSTHQQNTQTLKKQPKQPLNKKVSSLLINLTHLLNQLCLSSSFSNQVLTTLNPYIHTNHKLRNKQKYSHIHIKNNLIQFFQAYIPMLKAAISKISKYHCDQKLKYLIQTIIKQIFTHIIRLSYQIKLQFSNLAKKWKNKSISLLSLKLNVIFKKQGHLFFAFKSIQRQVETQRKADQKFVYKFEKKLMQLSAIHKNITYKLKSTYLQKWRVNNLKLQQQQNVLVLQFSNKLCSQIAFSHFKHQSIQWKSQFVNNFNNLLTALLNNFEDQSGQKSNLSNIIFIMNPQPQKNFTLKNKIQNLKIKNTPRIIQTCRSQQFSICSQYSQNSSKFQQVYQNSAAVRQFSNQIQSQIPEQIIKICIQSGQIKTIKNCQIRQENGILSSHRFSQKNDKAILIPVNVSGVIQLKWKKDVNLIIFKNILKIVQQCSQMIYNSYILGCKIDYLRKQENEGNWQKQIFNQYLIIQDQAQKMLRFNKLPINLANNNDKKNQINFIDKKFMTLNTKQTWECSITDRFNKEIKFIEKPYGTYGNYIDIQNQQISQEASYLQQDDSYSLNKLTQNQLKQQIDNYNDAKQQNRKNLLFNRLAKYWMKIFKIDSLSIYHHCKNEFKQLKQETQKSNMKPCIEIQDTFPFSNQLVKSLNQQLKLKQFVIIKRNHINIYLFKISDGFCKIIFSKDFQNSSSNYMSTFQLISNCIIPLLYKNQLDSYFQDNKCNFCMKNKNITIPNNIQKIEEKLLKQQPTINEQNLINRLQNNFFKILSSQNLLQLQKNLYQSVKQQNLNQKVFLKIIYRLNSQNDSFWSIKTFKGQQGLSKFIQLPQISINQAQYELFSNNPYYSYILSLIKQNPMFDNPAIKLYQAEHRQTLRIIYIVNKKSIIFMGYFDKKSTNKDNFNDKLNILKKLSNTVMLNNLILLQGQISQWVSKKEYEEKTNQIKRKLFQNLNNSVACYQYSQEQNLFKQFKNYIEKSIENILKFKHQKQNIRLIKLFSKEKQLIKKKQLDLNSIVQEKLIDEYYQFFPQLKSICSHSRILSRQYHYSQKNDPTKNKMKKLLAYIPQFTSKDQQIIDSFRQYAQRKFKLQGINIHPNFQKLSQAFSLDKQKGYLMIPNIGQNFLVIIPIQISILVYLNQQTVDMIDSFLHNTLSKFLQYQRKSKKYQQKILIQQVLVPFYQKIKRQKILNVVYKIRQNYQIKINAVKQLQVYLNKIKEKSKFILTKQSYEALLFSYKNKNVKLNQKIIKLIQVLKRYLFSSFFQKLSHFSNKLQKMETLCTFFNKKYILNIQRALQLLKIKSNIKEEKNSNSKKQGCLIFFQMIKKKLQQNQRFIWKGCQKEENQMKYLSKMLKQQCELTNVFQNIKSYIQFFNERISCSIMQINRQIVNFSFGLIQNDILHMNNQSKFISKRQTEELCEKQQILMFKFDENLKKEHYLVFQLKIKQHNGSIQFKLTKQKAWLCQLSEKILKHTYLEYLQYQKRRLNVLKSAFPSIYKLPFNQIKKHANVMQMISLKQSKCQKMNKQRQYQLLNKQYKSALRTGVDFNTQNTDFDKDQDNAKFFNKKIKQLKQGLSEVEQKSNQSTIGYQIKRKRNAAYKMLFKLEKDNYAQNSKLFPNNQYKTPSKDIDFSNQQNQYLKQCSMLNEVRKNILIKGVMIMKRKWNKLCKNHRRQDLRFGFVKIWKVSSNFHNKQSSKQKYNRDYKNNKTNNMKNEYVKSEFGLIR